MRTIVLNATVLRAIIFSTILRGITGLSTIVLNALVSSIIVFTTFLLSIIVLSTIVLSAIIGYSSTECYLLGTIVYVLLY